MKFLQALCYLSAALSIVLLTACAEPKSVDTKPNVLLIVVDDAGYSDFGAYGSEIDTPTIDALANDSVVFSQFHVTPSCSTTRGSLLTGMDPHRTGKGTHAVGTENQLDKPGYEGYLNDRVATIAEVMKGAGYRTAMTGKWHMGNKDKATWPISRGFDKSYVLLNGGASHWQDNLPLVPGKPSLYSDNGELVKKLPEGFYSTTNYTDKMIEFVSKEDGSDKPFFGYLAYTAPHNPLHAPEELIEKYEDLYQGGWDQLQKTRLQGLKAKGLIADDVAIQQRPEFIMAWSELSTDEKANAARDMAVYAAMVDAVDQSLTRLFTHLKQQGLYDNTLIILMSDNGPSKTTMADYVKLGTGGDAFIKSFNNQFQNRGLPG
ncbi:MAG: sulfatase-like hydrolase/transferase, partial [Pseudomonadales bacterium]